MNVNDPDFDAAASEFRAGPGADGPAALAAAIDRAADRVPSASAFHFLYFVEITRLKPPRGRRAAWDASPATLRLDDAALDEVLRAIADGVAARDGLTDLFSRERAGSISFSDAMAAFYDGALDYADGDVGRLVEDAISQIEIFATADYPVAERARDFVAYVDALLDWGPDAVVLAQIRTSAYDLVGPPDVKTGVLRDIADRVAARHGIVGRSGAAGWPPPGFVSRRRPVIEIGEDFWGD